MLKCINTNSVEYQSLKEKAGIPEYQLKSICRRFMTQYDRFPHLDEIPNSNSEPFLREQLKVKSNNSVSISKVLEATGKNSIKEAIIDLNNNHRDLEIDIAPIVNDAIIDITHRPTDDFKETEPIEIDSNIDNVQVFNNTLRKLANLYGINFKTVTEAELNTEQWHNVIPDASVVNAFVYNGDIYVNVDRANVDAPLHEMFHIFVGSLRFTNPKLYSQLINSIESLPNYQVLAEQYQGRTRNDINEEIFVTEVAQNLVGLSDSLNGLDEATRYEINYNIKRMLDTVLMGQDSVKTISDNHLYTLSLKEIGQQVNSALMVNNSIFNKQDAELHRQLNNTKADLYKRGILEEVCF